MHLLPRSCALTSFCGFQPPIVGFRGPSIRQQLGKAGVTRFPDSPHRLHLTPGLATGPQTWTK